jgi:hypothetical protein
MRVPTRKQRIIGLPIIVIGVALVLVLTDQMLAARLELIYVCIGIYLGVEALMAGAKKWKKK